VLTEFLEWSREVLAARDMPHSALVRGVSLLQETLSARFPHTARLVADSLEELRWT
jgi:hypothetical protein